MLIYQKACDPGQAVSCYSLAMAYDHGEGVAQDKAKAVRLYQKACDRKDAQGCEALRKLGIARTPPKSNAKPTHP